MNSSAVSGRRDPWDSLFDSSIDAMREAEMPPGWLPTYRDMLVKLAAMSCPARADLYLACPTVGRTGDLDFELSRDDSAVQGLLRKTSRRLAHTCQQCGRRAKMRRVALLKWVTLCPPCWAPSAVASEVAELEGWTRGEPVVDSAQSGGAAVEGLRVDRQALPEEHVPPLLRQLVPPGAWRMLRDRTFKHLGRYLAREDALRLLPSFRAVVDQLPARLPRSTWSVAR